MEYIPHSTTRPDKPETLWNHVLETTGRGGWWQCTPVALCNQWERRNTFEKKVVVVDS